MLGNPGMDNILIWPKQIGFDITHVQTKHDNITYPLLTLTSTQPPVVMSISFNLMS